MDAVRAVAASHLRRNIRSSVLVAVLLAVAVASSLAAVAGARRTQGAIDEFVAADQGADGYAAFSIPAFGGSATPDLAEEAEAVEAVDGVTGTARFTRSAVEVAGPTIPGGVRALEAWVELAPGGLEAISTLHLVDGRHPAPDQPGEILVDELLARDAGLEVGSGVQLQAYSPVQLEEGFEGGAAGYEVDAEVVGIVRRPTDLRDPQTLQEQQNDYVVPEDVYVTAAFWEAAEGDVVQFNPVIGFDLVGGADLDGILATLTEELGAYSMDPIRFLEIDGTFNGVQRSADLHARALQIFAVVVALAGLFLVGQTLGRQIVLESVDDRTLRSLGMTSRQLRQAALLRAAPVALGGVVLGMVGAVGLSALTPLPGTVARRAELDPGVAVDATVLLLGGALAAVLALAAGVLPATRAVRNVDRGELTSARPTIASRLAARGLPAPAVIGARFALEPGRGRTAVPVRTAIATAAAALAFVLAAVGFAASMAASRDDPSRFGVTWDVAAGNVSAPEEFAAVADEVGSIPGVEAVAGLGTTAFDTPFGELPAAMIQQVEGTIEPLITSGRAPGEGEVAVGAITMREEGLEIGDELQVVDAIAGTESFRIVGTVVLNVAGMDVSIPPGRGALFDWSMLALLDEESASFIAPQMFLVDAEPGRIAEVEESLTALFPTSTRAAAVEPLDLSNLGDAVLLPSALAVVLGVVGLGAVIHAMFECGAATSARARRVEGARLRTPRHEPGGDVAGRHLRRRRPGVRRRAGGGGRSRGVDGRRHPARAAELPGDAAGADPPRDRRLPRGARAHGGTAGRIAARIPAAAVLRHD